MRVVLAAFACALACGTSETPGAPPTDGGLSPDRAPAPPRFCDGLARRPIFCADFDRGPVRESWTEELRTAGGTLETNPEAVSKPFALAAKTPPLRFGSEASAALFTRLTGVSPDAVRVEFDVLIGETCTESADAGHALMVLGRGSQDALALLVSQGSTQLSPVVPPAFVSPGATAKLVVEALPPALWLHTIVQIQRGDGGTDTMLLDVQPSGIHAEGSLPPLAGPSAPSLHVGLFTLSGGAATGCEVRFDNVVVTLP